MRASALALARPRARAAGRGLARHWLLRGRHRRAGGRPPLRRDRGAGRPRHALSPALADRSGRRREDHERDEDRRRLRPARGRAGDRGRDGAADRRHQHPEHRAGAAVRDPQPGRFPVPDRGSADADRPARRGRADRDGDRHGGRRGARPPAGSRSRSRSRPRPRRCSTAIGAASRSPPRTS